ncbi:hypothetical protein [Micromonospora sp. NPDC049662]|uniref:hypothetical protein n=1 Tax=Micromonospora sp. NPDC049662 TaxID=3155397 RepID=UPI00342DD2EB
MATAPAQGEGGAPAEVTGLSTAQSYAAGMTTACVTLASQSEQFVAALAGQGVEGNAAAAVARAKELTAAAGAAWAAACTALEGQDVVRQAYAAAPGSGDKTFVTDGATVAGTTKPQPDLPRLNLYRIGDPSPHGSDPAATATRADAASRGRNLGEDEFYAAPGRVLIGAANATPYLDWSRDRTGGGCSFEIGNGADALTLDLDLVQLRELRDSLSESLQDFDGSANAFTPVANGDAYIDWNDFEYERGFSLAAGDGTREVQFYLTYPQLRAWHDQLAADLRRAGR